MVPHSLGSYKKNPHSLGKNILQKCENESAREMKKTLGAVALIPKLWVFYI